MNTSTAAQLVKVQKVSAFVRSAFQTLMVLVAIAALLRLAVLVLMPDSAVTAAQSPSFDFRLNLLGIELGADEVRLPFRIFCGMALLLSVVIHMKILQHLVNLFSVYAQGLIFTRENVKQIRQIGITILISGLWIVLTLGFNILFAAAEPGTTTMESRFPSWRS